MHSKAKSLQAFDFWHKLAAREVQPMKFIVSGGVVVLLVIAWVLTNPLFQLRDKFVGRCRETTKHNNEN